MTTLQIPSFERRLLQTVKEEMAAKPVRDWPQPSLQLGMDVLQRMRKECADMRLALEAELADGVETRSFAREYGPMLPVADGMVQSIRELIDQLSPAFDSASEMLLAEFRLLEQEENKYRDLLAEALGRASEPPRPVDAERVRAAEEAYARGETKPFRRR